MSVHDIPQEKYCVIKDSINVEWERRSEIGQCAVAARHFYVTTVPARTATYDLQGKVRCKYLTTLYSDSFSRQLTVFKLRSFMNGRNKAN